MKKIPLINDIIIKKLFTRTQLLLRVITFSAVFSSAPIGVSNAWATIELDREFDVSSLGILKSWDNADGLFADYVAGAYADYFGQQSRFEVSDLSKANALISNTKIPYLKIINDLDVLKQVAKVSRVKGLLRTKVLKEGAKNFFTIDWLHLKKAPGEGSVELMASVNFTLEDPSNGNSFTKIAISKVFREKMDLLIAQVPFLGHVTGRDRDAITINLGMFSRIRSGDVLLIGTLDEVKRHPLLNQLVGWRLTPTGRIQVEKVDEKMAFCKVLEEEPNKQIARDQKVTEIISIPERPDFVSKAAATPVDKKPVQQPKLGWISTALYFGSYNRDYGSPSNPTFSGGGFALGGGVGGELWLTKEWFTDLDLGYSFWKFSQKNTSTGSLTDTSLSGGVNGSAFKFKINAGYSYLLNGDLMGPKVWAKLGIKSHSFGMPASTSENTGSVGINTIFIGTGGEIPLDPEWGLRGDLNLKLLTFVGQNWNSASVSGASDFGFSVGGFYRFSPRMTLRAGLDFESSSVDFSSGANLSQNMITFGPTLLYYF